MKRIGIGAAMAVAAAIAASSASAEIMDVVYTGTVAFGVDAAGVFGGGSLSGDAFMIALRFDTTRGYLASGPTASSAIGGGFLGNDSPALAATVTINGVSVAFGAPAYYGAIVACHDSGCTDGAASEQSHAATDTSDATRHVEITVKGGAYTAPDGDMNGYVQIDEPGGLGAFASFQSTTAALGTLTVSPAAVPEPATWALMLAGLGGLGLAGRTAARAGHGAARVHSGDPVREGAISDVCIYRSGGLDLWSVRSGL